MNWKEYEKRQYEYFCKVYDPNAIYKGGSDCHAPDIISEKYGIIEIKEPSAQCGQFSESNKDSTPYNKYISSKKRKSVTKDDAEMWTREYYKEKGVKGFLVDYKLYSYDEFFKAFKFELENRESKRSGSRELPKYAEKYIPKEWEAVKKEKKWYVTNTKYLDQKQAFYNTKGELCYMMPSSHSKGEIRVLSNYDTTSWMFKMDPRK